MIFDKKHFNYPQPENVKEFVESGYMDMWHESQKSM